MAQNSPTILHVRMCTLTLLEKYLAHYRIRYKLIKLYTPHHNGKVKRSHRKDNEYCYWGAQSALAAAPPARIYFS